MMIKVVCLVSLIGLTAASVLLSKGSAVSTQHVTRYDDGNQHAHLGIFSGYEHNSDPKYQFKYSVSDPHTKDQKSQQETRHGDVVQGEYSLLQPDGSYTKVEYTADNHNGFNAVVHNTGKNLNDGTVVVHDHY